MRNTYDDSSIPENLSMLLVSFQDRRNYHHFVAGGKLNKERISSFKVTKVSVTVPNSRWLTSARKRVEGPVLASSANWVQGCFSRVQNANGIAITRKAIFALFMPIKKFQSCSLITHFRLNSNCTIGWGSFIEEPGIQRQGCWSRSGSVYPGSGSGSRLWKLYLSKVLKLSSNFGKKCEKTSSKLFFSFRIFFSGEDHYVVSSSKQLKVIQKSKRIRFLLLLLDVAFWALWSGSVYNEYGSATQCRRKSSVLPPYLILHARSIAI